MTLKVKNFKISAITYDKKYFKDIDRCIEYVKLIVPDYKKYLPNKPQHKVEFELVDTNADFANCIRRFLLDEINVYSMDVNEDNITTDDRFILSDLLKKNIELIPFTQKINESECKDLTMSMEIVNTTDEIITVYSGDILVSDKKNKTLDNEKYFSSNIPIINLRSGKTLKIKDINIVNGCAKMDAGKFCLLSNLSYEILDIKPLNENKYSKTGQSSLVSNPAHFKFSYKTHRNIEPQKVMIMCCNHITNRLENLLKEMGNIKNDTNIYFSDLINVETTGEFKLFHLKGEYWTIANVISRYCYIIFKEIKFVCSSIIHPSTEESIVKIDHTEPAKIITSAIKAILSDIATVKKSFT